MRVPICCERGCDKPVDRPRSKVRCADHYTPPSYGGHNPPDRAQRSTTEKRNTS
jgi:hypothetical protein